MVGLERINKISIQHSIPILQGLIKMDECRVKMLFVFDGNKFLSLLTIGDIQRAIIRNIALSEPVYSILDYNKQFASEGESLTIIKEKMVRLRAECMPVINAQGELIDVLFWNDIFNNDGKPLRATIDLPVVIMAGGKGTRLRPLTNVIPKPLIPIGDKTILEEIMDQFESIGCSKFYMSVNYKMDMMKFYISQLEHHYNIEFIQEKKPLGTIGSISLLKGRFNTPFFVSNCDIIIDQDYRDAYDYHIQNNNEITLISAVKVQRIPYGVIEAGEDGLMQALTEKPEKTYMFNTGVYILNPNVINEIPSDEVFHITDLIATVKARGGRIGCFPVSETAWHDMGEWREYLKIIGYNA